MNLDFALNSGRLCLVSASLPESKNSGQLTAAPKTARRSLPPCPLFMLSPNCMLFSDFDELFRGPPATRSRAVLDVAPGACWRARLKGSTGFPRFLCPSSSPPLLAPGHGARNLKSLPIRVVKVSLLVTMPGAEILPTPTTRTQTGLASPGIGPHRRNLGF